ncbi:MAG: Holliday junction branch migration protein RuvA [Gammaproteobacteria bacterium]|nr:Holliday junction branch migration protein RuvA [Gammaproteobacteria bacterium]
MIGRIKGILIEKQPPFILVDVNGVGYEIQVSMNTFYRFPQTGELVTLLTQHIVREDASLLYGFVDIQEKTMFQHLIKVNGVGPKTALAILSGLNPDELMQCIAANDVPRLSSAPGIGKKTAERLIVEMKGHLANWEVSSTKIPSFSISVDNPIQEAITALIALGYKPSAARQMIAKVNQEGLSSEALIRQALKDAAM